MLSSLIDIFKIRQGFNALTGLIQFAEGIAEDQQLVTTLRRAVLPLPFDPHTVAEDPFPPLRRSELAALSGRRLALMASGGSGALASVVGVARALEESGLRPDMISTCSGSALFGFPLGAGLTADEAATFVLSLSARDYVDVNWEGIAKAVPTLGRGFAGFVKGEALEATYRRLLGDMTLGEMEIPTYAPIWSIEENRVDFLGPKSHPDLPVARAIRLAVTIPLFIDPVPLNGEHWCDGGIVDIFPVRPVLDIESPPDLALGVNGFYPPDFAGEDVTGWRDKPLSIIHAAGQLGTCQQIELARANLARLRGAAEVHMIDPVPYQKVRGVGFYRQFLDNSDWAAFMRAGRELALAALREAAANAAPRPEAAAPEAARAAERAGSADQAVGGVTG